MYPLALHLPTTATSAYARSAMPDAPVAEGAEDVSRTSANVRRIDARSTRQVLRRLLDSLAAGRVATAPGPRR